MKKNNNTRLIEIINNPLLLIKEGSKLGVKAIKYFMIVSTFFVLSNVLLLIFAIIRLFISDIPINSETLLYVAFIGIFGTGVSIYAIYKAYQYVIFDTLRTIYKGLEDIMMKVSAYVVDKAEILFKDNGVTDKKLEKALDIKVYFNTTYVKLPIFLRKRIILLLKQVPYVGMLVDLRDDILKGDKEKAAKEIYNRTNSFIMNSVFSDVNNKWVWFIYIINISVSLYIILYQI